jgi:acetamidase/formamidase
MGHHPYGLILGDKAAPWNAREAPPASLKPLLTIDSGDIVRLWTTTGNPRYFERLGVPKEKIPAELYAAFEGAPGAGRDDHTLDGPIEVRGAEIGDTVEIKIRSIDLSKKLR